MRAVGGGAEVGRGEYFLIFVSGGLTVFIVFPGDCGNEVIALRIVAFLL